MRISRLKGMQCKWQNLLENLKHSQAQSTLFKTNPGSAAAQNRLPVASLRYKVCGKKLTLSHHVSSSENPVESQVLMAFDKSRRFGRFSLTVQGLPLQLIEFGQFCPLQFPHPSLLTWQEGQRRGTGINQIGGVETKI